MLADTGRRSTNQALQRADPVRRYPILLATLAETYVEVLDELVQLLDQALATSDSRARHEVSQRVVDRARAGIDRGRLLDEVLDILADPAVPDTAAGALVRARIGMPHLQAARRDPDQREPRDLYASVLAYACNLGYAGMADASGISEDTLAWTSQWYLRPDTLRAANTVLVNAHHAPPPGPVVGRGDAVVLGRSTLPATRAEPDRAGVVAVLPRRRNHDVHPRLGPALYVRHESDPEYLAGGRRRPR